MDLSILIATYKNSQYLEECFNSIYESIGDYNVEVLVGIDSCIESYDFIKNSSYPPNFSFYFFEKNNGPYIVFNSLSKIARSENIMFFGSDDIMDKNMISDMINGLNKFDCVKPSYVNFNDGQEINIKSKKLIGEGVFGIKKSSFDYMNGFEPWMCAADSDFMGRIYKNKNRINYTNNINFYRRIHKNGLTSRTDTGMGSPLRSHYAKLSREKKVAGPLEIMVTEPFVIINGGPYIPQTKPNNIFIKKTENPINRLFSGRGGENEIQVKEIDYNKVNDVVGKRELKKVPDKVKTENKSSNLNSIKNPFIIKKIQNLGKNRPNRGDGSIKI
jgi:glycosyltransferase involved in cell wall biosynthesis